MKTVKLPAKLLFILSLFTLPLRVSAKPCLFKGHIFSQVVEFKSPKYKKSILVLEMFHIADQQHFHSAMQATSKFIHSHSGQIKVLNEFWTCQGSVIDYRYTPKTPASQQRQLLDAIQRISQQKVSPKEVSSLFPMKISSSTCELGDFGHRRPSYINQKYLKNCRWARAHKLSCQWEIFKIPPSDRVTVTNGDLVLHELSLNQQILAATMFKTITPNTKVDKTWFKKVKQKFIYKQRDLRVSRLALESVKQNQHVVLPWGSNHRPGIEQQLAKSGFTPQSSQYIPVGTQQKFQTLGVSYKSLPQCAFSSPQSQKSDLGGSFGIIPTR